MGETEAQTTIAADDERASVQRKDSGMSMDSAKLPETATPKAKDFATTIDRSTTKNRNVRNEKHDTKKVLDKGSKAANKAPASVLSENKHKENSNMLLRRMKNMALAPLHIGGGKA